MKTAINFILLFFLTTAAWSQTNTFPSSGNVGIGTTSTSAKLDILPTNGNAILIRPFGTAANNTGQIQFRELSANGNNYVAFRAPDALSSNYIYRLPTAYGTNGQVLSTTGSGVLTWTTLAGGGGASTSLNNLTSTSINQSLLPGTTNTRDLGSASRAWRNIYALGTVGIGTTAPLFRLDVMNGSINTDTDYKIDGYTSLVADYSSTLVGRSSNPASTGQYNTAVGAASLSVNTSGAHNATLGSWSLLQNTTGDYNVAVGMGAGQNNTSGDFNTLIGSSANYYNTTGNWNTLVGSSAGCNQGTAPNSFVAIGFNAGHVGSNSNTIEIGSTFVSYIGGNVGWSNFSDARIKDNVQSNVPGLAFITKLNPVTYYMNTHRQNELCGIVDTNEWEGKYDIEKIRQTGFLAQEVEQAAKACNFDFNGVQAPWGNAKLYSLQYAAFVVPLVKAVQELDKNNMDLKQQNAELKNMNEMLARRIERLERSSGITEAIQNEILLEQNAPNPFHEKTIIKYFIPETALNAEIKIYTVTGEEVRAIPVAANGNGQVEISGKTLSAGTYSYLLIVDGRTVATKQMILTK